MECRRPKFTILSGHVEEVLCFFIVSMQVVLERVCLVYTGKEGSRTDIRSLRYDGMIDQSGL